MNKITVFLLIVIMTLCFSLGATLQSKAQSKSFAGVIPFVTSNDRIGLFDQSNGKIYIYDDNISHCLFTGQLTELGRSIDTVSNNTPTGITNLQ